MVETGKKIEKDSNCEVELKKIGFPPFVRYLISLYYNSLNFQEMTQSPGERQ